MSVINLRMSFLSLGPRVWTEGDILCARTHLLVQLLSLLSFRRKVFVDRHQQTVDVLVRRLWVWFSHERFTFDEFSHIEYGFKATGTSWGWTGTSRTSWGASRMGYGRHDQIERYTVDLVVKETDRHVRLFTFIGEGAVNTGMAGVILGGDKLVDYSGNQDVQSRNYVTMLQAFTGLSLTRPWTKTHLADEQGHRWVCEACGRPVPPNKDKCQYCGGAITKT